MHLCAQVRTYCCQCFVHGLHLDIRRGTSYHLLMAAGMDAQHMEAKLLDEANAAWEAYLAEKDPARSDELEKRWNKAQDTLERVSRATGGWR